MKIAFLNSTNYSFVKNYLIEQGFTFIPLPALTSVIFNQTTGLYEEIISFPETFNLDINVSSRTITNTGVNTVEGRQSEGYIFYEETPNLLRDLINIIE